MSSASSLVTRVESRLLKGASRIINDGSLFHGNGTRNDWSRIYLL